MMSVFWNRSGEMVAGVLAHPMRIFSGSADSGALQVSASAAIAITCHKRCLRAPSAMSPPAVLGAFRLQRRQHVGDRGGGDLGEAGAPDRAALGVVAELPQAGAGESFGQRCRRLDDG